MVHHLIATTTSNATEGADGILVNDVALALQADANYNAG